MKKIQTPSSPPANTGAKPNHSKDIFGSLSAPAHHWVYGRLESIAL